MMNYELEELVPIVAELTEKYTSKESSSITYETAQELMGAVLYCIAMAGGAEATSSYPVVKPLNAKETYQYGYELVLETVRKVGKRYNEMIVDFHAYENENYYDTVTKAIPGFFKLYNARFAPQETIITMDYPTITPIVSLTGIHAIKKYVDYICLEQQFLSRLPHDYIISVLNAYQSSYRKQFYNICSIILRHILGNTIVRREVPQTTDTNGYRKLEVVVLMYEKDELRDQLLLILKQLIAEQYQNNQKMFEYMAYDCNEFAIELRNAVPYKQLDKVVAL